MLIGIPRLEGTMNTVIRGSVFVVVVGIVLAAAVAASGADYFVNPEGTGDFPTIQAAIDSAGAGDYVYLTDGTFTGEGNRNIYVPAKEVYIVSLNNEPTLCIIDCEGGAREERRGFHFDAGGGRGDAQLGGVGVINGYTEWGGGGIWVSGGSPVISNCVVANCTAAGTSIKGGGIYVNNSATPAFINCTITGNTAQYGSGVAVDGSAPLFHGCTIIDNDGPDYNSVGGGVWMAASGLAQFDQCSIVSNSAARAGGIRMLGSEALLTYCNISRNDATAGHSGGVWLQGGEVSWCTIVDNSSAEGGGGVHCHAGWGVLYRSIIAFNSPGFGVGASEGNMPTLGCCDVYGNPDGNYDAVVGDMTGIYNNFSEDPGFCGFDIEDYRLFDTSPCLGHAECEDVGAYGEGCDSPVEAMSWGGIKALYE